MRKVTSLHICFVIHLFERNYQKVFLFLLSFDDIRQIFKPKMYGPNLSEYPLNDRYNFNFKTNVFCFYGFRFFRTSQKKYLVNVSIYILKKDFNIYKMRIVLLMGNE